MKWYELFIEPKNELFMCLNEHQANWVANTFGNGARSNRIGRNNDNNIGFVPYICFFFLQKKKLFDLDMPLSNQNHRALNVTPIFLTQQTLSSCCNTICFYLWNFAHFIPSPDCNIQFNQTIQNHFRLISILWHLHAFHSVWKPFISLLSVLFLVFLFHHKTYRPELLWIYTFPSKLKPKTTESQDNSHFHAKLSNWTTIESA